MHPSQVSILGVGLLGGSLGLALRRSLSICKIIGYGHRAESLTQAQKRGAIDAGYDDPAEAVRDSDLVILCTPVGTFENLLSKIAPSLKPGSIVTDVGSTKRSIALAAEKLLPGGVHFVGSHPMAGSEKRGVEHARADLFDGALCIVTPTERTDRTAIETVEKFWQLIGMRTVRLSPQEHDARLAAISHMPHALAAALVATQETANLPLTGKGFLDMTRIAAGDAGLWRDIFIDNRDNLAASLRSLQRSLDGLLDRLDPSKADELFAWLADAAQRRAKMNVAGSGETDGADEGKRRA